MPDFLRRFGERHRTAKVRIAERVARQVHPDITYRALRADVVDSAVAAELIDCDCLFLCADSAQARLVVNALVHRYLIPGIQMGAKAPVNVKTGAVVDAFAVTGPIIPGAGCLWCNGLISPSRLQEEATTGEQLERQRYVDDRVWLGRA